MEREVKMKISRYLYGEFMKNSGMKKRMIIIFLLIVSFLNILIQFYNIGIVRKFISYNTTYYGLVNVGFVIGVLTLWAIIWHTNKARGY